MLSSDQIIEYCNFLLQTHFRLSNVFKIIKHKDQLEDAKIKQKLNDQILGLIYNILTESLALNTQLSLDDQKENEIEESREKETSYWSEIFIKSFKELKNYFKKPNH